MKRIFLLLFFILLSGSAAFAGPVVTVVNNTGYPISYLYISTNNTDDWEEDVLGRQVLGNGETVRVTLPETGVWDFKAVDADGDNYFKWNVMIRADATITFTMSDYKATNENNSSRGETWVTVDNQTGYSIFYLYISRDESNEWEEDILGDEVLINKEKVRVTLPGPGIWDFKAVDEDDDKYFRYNVSISEGANQLVFRLSDMD